MTSGGGDTLDVSSAPRARFNVKYARRFWKACERGWCWSEPRCHPRCDGAVRPRKSAESPAESSSTAAICASVTP